MNLTLIVGEDEKHMLPQIRAIIAQMRQKRRPEITIEIERESQSNKDAVSTSDERDGRDAQ
jgi:hypothetical protein